MSSGGLATHRATSAVVCWARTTHMHCFSVYAPHALHETLEEEQGRMFAPLPEKLAALGRPPPPLLGRDWNVEPPEFTLHLEENKCALHNDNTHLNEAKEQVYGATLAGRRAWEAQGRVAVEVARNLGVFHRSRRAHPTLLATMQAQRSVATRLGCLGGPRQRRGAMAVAAFLLQGPLRLRNAMGHPPPDAAIAGRPTHKALRPSEILAPGDVSTGGEAAPRPVGPRGLPGARSRSPLCRVP